MLRVEDEGICYLGCVGLLFLVDDLLVYDFVVRVAIDVVVVGAQLLVFYVVFFGDGFMGELVRWIDMFDWLIIDVGLVMGFVGVVGYLYGWCVFIVCLYVGVMLVVDVFDYLLYWWLYGVYMVGYFKDVVFWMFFG